MKSTVASILIIILSTNLSAQNSEKVLHPKVGFYVYQNIGLKGGVGIAAYPFKSNTKIGFRAGTFYYRGGLLQNFSKVTNNYSGIEVGFDFLKERYHKKSSGSKKSYRGFNVSAFYTKMGKTNRSDWWDFEDCGHSAGPVVNEVENSSLAYGISLNYRFSRAYESDRFITVFSVLPEVRIIKSTSDYEVSCDRIKFHKESVESNLFPVSLKLQMDVLLKL